MDARWAQPCLVHTARKVFEVPEALEFNPVREVNLKTLSHWTILRGVHFMLWCFISGGSHGWLFEQEKFLSHPPFSPYSLSPHCPKSSTCRSLTYIQGGFFNWSALKMTKCQITCKSLQKSSKCQNFLRVWHLVIFRADQLKKPPCIYQCIYVTNRVQ